MQANNQKPATRIINGRLYAEGTDGVFRVVPRSMDDARELKMHPVPEYKATDL